MSWPSTSWAAMAQNHSGNAHLLTEDRHKGSGCLFSVSGSREAIAETIETLLEPPSLARLASDS